MLYDKQIAGQVADFLLEIKAVIFRPEQPFKWTSGWYSPIYCDNRLILSEPDARDFIIDSWASAVTKLFPGANAIAGVATAGIAHAALIADRLNLPMAYIRSKPKEHGTEKFIEGKLEAGTNTLIIEDLVSTGKSSAQAIDNVRNEGIKVNGLMSVFSYGFPLAENLFKKQDITFYSLCNYEILLERALEKTYISAEQLPLLKQWREAPEAWAV